MKVPCERYRLLWVGADGTVQLCYVTFKLGDLHEKRLAEMLFTAVHEQAFSRDAFSLKCPNCHCSYHNRIEGMPPAACDTRSSVRAPINYQDSRQSRSRIGCHQLHRIRMDRP